MVTTATVEIATEATKAAARRAKAEAKKAAFAEAAKASTEADHAERAAVEESKTFSLVLPVKLTDAESRAEAKSVAAEQASLDHDMVTEKVTIDEIKAGWKARKEALHKRVLGLGKGEADRDVRCKRVTDIATNAVSIVRLDTGETVEAEAMSAEERQTELFDDGDDDRDADLFGEHEDALP